MVRVLRVILVSVWVNFVIWVVVGIVFGFARVVMLGLVYGI